MTTCQENFLDRYTYKVTGLNVDVCRNSEEVRSGWQVFKAEVNLLQTLNSTCAYNQGIRGDIWRYGAITTKFAVLWHGTSCSLVDRYYPIVGTCWMPVQDRCCVSLSRIHWQQPLICPFHAFLTSAYAIYLPPKNTVLISTNITWTSAICFGTCVPSSWRTQCHFLKTKR